MRRLILLGFSFPFLRFTNCDSQPNESIVTIANGVRGAHVNQNAAMAFNIVSVIWIITMRWINNATKGCTIRKIVTQIARKSKLRVSAILYPINSRAEFVIESFRLCFHWIRAKFEFGWAVSAEWMDRIQSVHAELRWRVPTANQDVYEKQKEVQGRKLATFCLIHPSGTTSK